MTKLSLPERTLIDHVVLQEDIGFGEHVRAFEIQMPVPGEHFPPVTIYKGENIGHKAICRFPAIAAESMIIHVTKADGDVTMSTMEFHYTCNKPTTHKGEQ